MSDDDQYIHCCPYDSLWRRKAQQLKFLLSCLSDTTTERIAMKHKGDDSGMNSFAVNYMFSSLCTLAVLLLWGRELFDRWLQAKHCLLGCYACTDDEVSIYKRFKFCPRRSWRRRRKQWKTFAVRVFHGVWRTFTFTTVYLSCWKSAGVLGTNRTDEAVVHKTQHTISLVDFGIDILATQR